jgi:hypothetical protein
MSDARQSPIPQDRVNENVEQRERAETSKFEKRMQDRHMEKQAVDDRAGRGDQEQPGISDEPKGPAEGGD